jgi:outer membrane protein OmpA-like peptidoglycan-associated protein
MLHGMLTLLALVGTVADGAGAPAPAKVPLCSGLTIVTAISQPEGDYESIKTITSVTPAFVQLKYSTEHPVAVPGRAPKLLKLELSRTLQQADLARANLYLQQYQANLPTEVPGTTAIGVSRAVLSALKTRGAADVGMFDVPAVGKIAANRAQHPNVFDSVETYKLQRVESGPVMLPFVVNDKKVQLPAIHATGRSDYYGYKGDFYFLDDESNPLALKWRVGIGAGAGQNAASDRDSLQVTKISYNCTVATNPSESGVTRLERALADTGRTDIYTIYFSFNSDEIRDESEPTLRDLAEVLKRHPDWKLSIGGHTDAIGGDARNLELSKHRSAAVKNALVARFGVNATRLATDGYGKSRPIETNETPEGRARNRRVELVRQ